MLVKTSEVWYVFWQVLLKRYRDHPLIPRCRFTLRCRSPRIFGSMRTIPHLPSGQMRHLIDLTVAWSIKWYGTNIFLLLFSSVEFDSWECDIEEGGYEHWACVSHEEIWRPVEIFLVKTPHPKGLVASRRERCWKDCLPERILFYIPMDKQLLDGDQLRYLLWMEVSLTVSCLPYAAEKQPLNSWIIVENV